MAKGRKATSYSDGNFRAESKHSKLHTYAEAVHRIGSKPLVNYWIMDRRGGPMTGGYRGAPKELTYQFSDAMLFVGTCAEGI